MNIETRASNVTLSASLLELIERKLDHVERRFGSRFAGVVVRLSDVNGPRGGKDKCCRILVRRDAHASFVVEALDADIYVAVSRAVSALDERLERSARPPSQSARPRRSTVLRGRRTAGARVQAPSAGTSTDRWGS